VLVAKAQSKYFIRVQVGRLEKAEYERRELLETQL
jgi:hypothetical protein